MSTVHAQGETPKHPPRRFAEGQGEVIGEPPNDGPPWEDNPFETLKDHPPGPESLSIAFGPRTSKPPPGTHQQVRTSGGRGTVQRDMPPPGRPDYLGGPPH